MGHLEAEGGKPAKAEPTKGRPAQRIAAGLVAALLLAGAGLLFYEMLQAVDQAYMVVSTSGWLLVGFLSILFGVLAFAVPSRLGLAWRFIAGTVTALVVASGVLFAMGVLLALMSGIG
jgi:hypothetical protein